mgnify:FL=1
MPNLYQLAECIKWRFEELSGYLPCGVTDAMCDGYDPPCGRCGHLYSDHYETDEEMDNRQFDYKKNNIEELLNETGSHESGQIQYNADGIVSHACDCTRGKTQEEKIKNQCDCEGFSDEPYEPDWDSMNEDLD